MQKTRWLATCVLAGLLFSCSGNNDKNSVKSPDGRIAVHFNLNSENRPSYKITLADTVILDDSRLGILREDADFASDLHLTATSEVEQVQDAYLMAHGKQQKFDYLANRRTFHLANEDGEQMDIIFQVSNDGVAFRYYFPGDKQGVKINHELTSFNFKDGTKSWIQPMAEAKSGWCNVNPSYEEVYVQNIAVQELPESAPGWIFPALFNYQDVWLLLSETAPDRDYCGCRLRHSVGGTEFEIGFPNPAEIFPGGGVNPESDLPWYTPWRLIVVGDLATIVESTLGTDLAKPALLENPGQFKPGRSAWSWALFKDDSTIYPVQKRMIDYAADMGWDYVLIDTEWDKRIGYEKVAELANYAKSKGVNLTMWYNSSGDWNTTVYSPKSKLLTSEDRDREFAEMQKMGITGVKVDFFGGDGQSMMAYYQDIFEDAAKYGLLVDCHGSTLPRGWQRTYPNMMTMESVRGFEFVTFEQPNADLQATHSTLLPFTRNVFDPMDFTPVCFSEIPNIQRQTSNGFELALAVLFLSGVQHYAEVPEGMAKVPDYVKEVIGKIPVSWQESRFVDGYPGKFVVIARRAADGWYVAGINGENVEKPLSLDLSFLQKAGAGTVITDGDDNRSFARKEMAIAPAEPFEITLRGNGGFLLQVTE